MGTMSVCGQAWSRTNGEEKYKARFVAKGYSQIPNVDYHETFSPTSVRMLMQLAVQDNLVVHQMDVKTAYLNAPIDCEIYIEQPERFEQQDKNGVKLVCKLQKIFVWSETEWTKLEQHVTSVFTG